MDLKLKSVKPILINKASQIQVKSSLLHSLTCSFVGSWPCCRLVVLASVSSWRYPVGPFHLLLPVAALFFPRAQIFAPPIVQFWGSDNWQYHYALNVSHPEQLLCLAILHSLLPLWPPRFLHTHIINLSLIISLNPHCNWKIQSMQLLSNLQVNQSHPIWKFKLLSFLSSPSIESLATFSAMKGLLCHASIPWTWYSIYFVSKLS